MLQSQLTKLELFHHQHPFNPLPSHKINRPQRVWRNTCGKPMLWVFSFRFLFAQLVIKAWNLKHRRENLNNFFSYFMENSLNWTYIFFMLYGASVWNIFSTCSISRRFRQFIGYFCTLFLFIMLKAGWKKGFWCGWNKLFSWRSFYISLMNFAINILLILNLCCV